MGPNQMSQLLNFYFIYKLFFLNIDWIEHKLKE